jgi:predicted nucleotidyltransferase
MYTQTGSPLTDKLIILSVLKNKLKEAYPNSIESVILFGSQATNTATEFSDYDILIIFKTDYVLASNNRALFYFFYFGQANPKMTCYTLGLISGA